MSKQDWLEFTRNRQVHILQSSEWGILKSEYGWRVEHLIKGDCGAQILFRELPFGYSIGYIPKGPVGGSINELLPELDDTCRKHKAVFLKVEPYLWEEEKSGLDSLPPIGFIASRHKIQPKRTILIDLSPTEDDILAAMKQKTRYNIRLAFKKGVEVVKSVRIDVFYKLMEETAQRDGFGIHAENYYQRAYELFHPQGNCELFLAVHEGDILAGVMVFAYGDTAWYFYGASSNRKRNLMPTYALHWEVIKWAKSKGCLWYDLWGVPDEDQEVLESQFSERSDGLWGVYRFKRGFGGELKRSLGPWDRVYKPRLYRLYLLYQSRLPHFSL